MTDETRAWLAQVAGFVKAGEISMAQAHAAVTNATQGDTHLHREFVATLESFVMNGGPYEDGFATVDLQSLHDNDLEETWLVDDVWPDGRQVHLHAPRKTGKSLLFLWMAANLATGREPFSGARIEPKRIGMVDNEMTPLDLKQRLFDTMGFAPTKLLRTNLLYMQHSVRMPLDTSEGGALFVHNMRAMHIEAVIIDAFSRVVKGEENSNDTYRDFYRYTGEPLKAEGIGMARGDNEGHHEGRSRGASAKADDVDLVWQLKATETGVELVRMATRIGNIPERIALTMIDEPLAFHRGMRSWPVGVFDKAAELDAMQLPDSISVRSARKAFADAGIPAGKTVILAAAIRYRRETRKGL